MKKTDFFRDYNKFPKVSIILISVSIILLLIVLLAGRNDLTTAMLILVSLVNFLTGIIIITFTERRGINPEISAMLYPSLITDKAGIFSELNVYGDAHFIPYKLTNSDETLQFNPVEEYNGFKYTDSFFSIENEDYAGIYSKSSSSALIKHLKENYGLSIPSVTDLPDSVTEILKDIIIEITSFCENIEFSDDKENIIINLKNFSLINGCREIRKMSPKCCTVSPCPVCSLICSIIAEYYGKPIAVSAIRTDPKKPNVMIILRVLSHPPNKENLNNTKLFY